MNAFDLIVTVALGSTLATVILSKDVALAEGATAFAMLAGAQLAVTWLSVRSKRVRRWVKAEPTMLVRNGNMLPEAMKRERVTSDEIEAAVRGAGYDELATIALVVLETDGSMSVVPRANLTPADGS